MLTCAVKVSPFCSRMQLEIPWPQEATALGNMLYWPTRWLPSYIFREPTRPWGLYFHHCHFFFAHQKGQLQSSWNNLLPQLKWEQHCPEWPTPFIHLVFRIKVFDLPLDWCLKLFRAKTHSMATICTTCPWISPAQVSNPPTCASPYWFLASASHFSKALFFFLFVCFTFFFYCSGFCHTLKWISHGFTCVPHPDPRSHLPLHP